MDEKTLKIVRGLIVSFIAWATTAAASWYLYKVFWEGTAPDFKIELHDQPIPPQTYAILLLAIWSGAQRLQTRYRPPGETFRWLDMGSSLAFAAFVIVTAVKVGFNNPNPTFLPIIVAFAIAALVDVLLNSERRMSDSSIGVGRGAPHGDGVLTEIPARVRIVEAVMPNGRVITFNTPPAIDHGANPPTAEGT